VDGLEFESVFDDPMDVGVDVAGGLGGADHSDAAGVIEEPWTVSQDPDGEGPSACLSTDEWKWIATVHPASVWGGEGEIAVWLAP